MTCLLQIIKLLQSSFIEIECLKVKGPDLEGIEAPSTVEDELTVLNIVIRRRRPDQALNHNRIREVLWIAIEHTHKKTTKHTFRDRNFEQEIKDTEFYRASQ